ncbi:uncharacterized protein K452DRAFT_291020 [Aplosporella prunicola CBS 121167]|uniref:Cytidyltransferase-like domain-containing protein n=1 Tax=Aplosporella prunicola CBS 121167 TaxID=1176127 RepID=A0A6A6B2E0_9PEZI|nr:uncharacterized protein K452DRAFT_291020 [Aplosporella prunicola CBS 121167]KAF2137986.1 hypothetical protein K452DRAFT_291020 [Aplosporella prunicola CBS 121167]
MPSSESPRRRTRSLLLLPPPPSPPTLAALKAAYAATLLTALRELQRTSRSTPDAAAAVLEIALPCPHLYGRETAPRSLLYPRTQALVAGLYKLICVIAAADAIDVEDADGVDARILLLAYPRDGNLTRVGADGSPEADSQGPVVDVATLARCGRPWERVFAVETESGERLLKSFLGASSRAQNVQRLRGGITQVFEADDGAAVSASASEPRKHYSVAVGGTFDHLHNGHKLLLTMTAFAVEAAAASPTTEQARSITIGITGDALLQNKKYAEALESWAERQGATYDFLSTILDFSPNSTTTTEEIKNPGPNGHAVNVTLPARLTLRHVEIWDPFGPTITDESISALVLSGETRAGGKAVDAKRREKGWPDLEVFEVDVLDALDGGEGAGGKVNEGAGAGGRVTEGVVGGQVNEEGAGVEGAVTLAAASVTPTATAPTPVDQSFHAKLSSTEIRRLQLEKRARRG